MLNIHATRRDAPRGLAPATLLLLVVLLLAPHAAHAAQLKVTVQQPADRWMNPAMQPSVTFDVVPAAASGGTTEATSLTLRGNMPDGAETWDGYYRFSRVSKATMGGWNMGGATCNHVFNSNIATCDFPAGFVGPATVEVDVSAPHSFVEDTSVSACEGDACETILLGSRTPGPTSLSIEPGPKFPSSIVPNVTTRTSLTIHNAGIESAQLVVLEPVKLGPIDVQLWSLTCAGTSTGLCQLSSIPPGASVEVPIELRSSMPVPATAPTIAVRVHTKGDNGIDTVAPGAESIALPGRAAWIGSVAATAPPQIPRLQIGTRLTRVALLRTGVQSRIHCPSACSVTSSIKAAPATLRQLHLRSSVLGTGSARRPYGGIVTAATRLNATARAHVIRAHGRVSLKHVLTVRCNGHTTTLTQPMFVTL